MRSQLSPQSLPNFASAPTAGANTGALFRVGASLYYDNGTVLVPLDLQGDWAGRTVTDADGTLAANDNVVFMSSASAHTFGWVPSSTTAFPLNKLVDVIALGTGAVTITAPTGVTFVGPGVTGPAGSYAVVVPAQGKAVSLIQRALNTWQVLGGFVAPFIKCTLGDGSGASVAATVPANTYPPFSTVPMDTVVKAIGGFTSGSLSSNLVAIPLAGTYLAIAHLRPADGQSVRSVVLGVGASGLSTVDSYWDDTVSTRYTVQRSWFIPFVAGDSARAYAYSDGSSLDLWNASLSLQWMGP